MEAASKKGKFISPSTSIPVKFFIFGCATALGFLAATGSFAQTTSARPGSDRARIRQGVKSGELTRAEAARVRTQQADAQQARKVARADGTVTANERAVIRREEKQADRVLYKQKHDEQTRKPR